MSANKNIDRICVAVTICAVLFTVLFMNGERFGIQKIVDKDSEYYDGDEYFTENDMNGNWDTSDATVITLEGDSAVVRGNGAYVNGSEVVITGAGRYLVSGTLTDGKLDVDAYDSSKVFIMLDGVDITCSDDAAFRVERAEKVFLTLAEGSVNSFTSGETYSDEALEDNTGGTLFSHDDLTINGSGSLEITASYKHGIDANDEFVVTGGTITITCPEDGVHVNDSIRLCNADITVNAGDDALHCDKEIIVTSGKILINECYEGLEAPYIEVSGGDITIYPEDDGFNANGGTSLMGMGGGMPGGNGGGPGGVPGQRDSENQEDPGQQTQGTGEDPGKQASETQEGSEKPDAGSPTDAENERESERMGATSENPGAGDKENDGGSAGADISDSEEETPRIVISGGTITIINETGRDADGLDSNGDILITGGDIRVSLTNSGSNSAIDYGSESGGVCEITGGTVIACGSYSMAEHFDTTSTQCSALYNFSDGAEDGTVFSLEDSDGNTLISWEVPCSFSSVNVSCPEMEQGGAYKIVIGDLEESITLDEVSASYGDASSSMFGGTMNFGGMQNRTGGMRHGGPGGRKGSGRSGDTSDQSGSEEGTGSQDKAAGMPEMPADMSEMPEMPTDMEGMPEIPSDMSEMPERPTDMEGMSPGENGDMQDRGGQGGGPGGAGPGGGFGESEETETQDVDTRISLSELTTEQKGMLAGSVAAVIVAIAAAVVYRRRR
ncbi:MAG: carbohydrate-binding domain-containing protein [Lachnospiraceae bacterium]|nr:carbohydrate-binding domain-containing protein [Lachnospiraceae bacterium]